MKERRGENVPHPEALAPEVWTSSLPILPFGLEPTSPRGSVLGEKGVSLRFQLRLY